MGLVELSQKAKDALTIDTLIKSMSLVFETVSVVNKSTATSTRKRRISNDDDDDEPQQTAEISKVVRRIATTISHAIAPLLLTYYCNWKKMLFSMSVKTGNSTEERIDTGLCVTLLSSSDFAKTDDEDRCEDRQTTKERVSNHRLQLGMELEPKSTDKQQQ